MTPVVISGGSGTRLWPVSRTKLPKQFCELFDQSLQTLALKRAARLGTPWVLTSQALRDLTEQNLKQLGLKDSKALYEPQAKNTGPAIAFLCQYLILAGKQSEVVAVLPADQLIENEEHFLSAMALAETKAENNKIVTLGIQPHYPATGFGYIQTQTDADTPQKISSSFAVIKFHEKPDLATAKEFLKNGSYFWNAGIFVFKVSVMAELFAKHQPEIWSAAQSIQPNLSNLSEVYARFRNISIDYAIMEKLGPDLLHCVPADIGWNDVGSWDAVADILKDVPSGPEVIEVQAKGNFIHPLENRVYALVGVEDLVIVDTADALLISKKGYSQEVKTVVDKVKALHPKLVHEHIFEDRPWGRFEILKTTAAFQSKIIRVQPFQQISYQSHRQREEHWLFVKGRGEVVLDDKILPVSKGSYVRIPSMAKHRIRNIGEETIEFVEVQLGTYFGEDDITRYQDDYQRT